MVGGEVEATLKVIGGDGKVGNKSQNDYKLYYSDKVVGEEVKATLKVKGGDENKINEKPKVIPTEELSLDQLSQQRLAEISLVDEGIKELVSNDEKEVKTSEVEVDLEKAKANEDNLALKLQPYEIKSPTEINYELAKIGDPLFNVKLKLRQNSDKTTDGKVEIEANGEVIAKDTEVEGEGTAPETNKNGFNLSLAEKTHLQPNKSFRPQLPVDNL